MSQTKAYEKLLETGIFHRGVADCVEIEKKIISPDGELAGLGEEKGNYFYICSDGEAVVSRSQKPVASCVPMDIKEVYRVVAQVKMNDAKALAFRLFFELQAIYEITVKNISWHRQKILKEETGECRNTDFAIVRLRYEEKTIITDKECIDLIEKCC